MPNMNLLMTSNTWLITVHVATANYVKKPVTRIHCARALQIAPARLVCACEETDSVEWVLQIEAERWRQPAGKGT